MLKKPIMQRNNDNNLTFLNISVVSLACKSTHRVLCLWLNEWTVKNITYNTI